MCEATNNLSIEELDVRSLDLAQRHEKICERIDELAFGASFVLINDHDPKPLYDQLETEYPNQFYWDYLENGTVRIARRDLLACESRFARRYRARWTPRPILVERAEGQYLGL